MSTFKVGDIVGIKGDPVSVKYEVTKVHAENLYSGRGTWVTPLTRRRTRKTVILNTTLNTIVMFGRVL